MDSTSGKDIDAGNQFLYSVTCRESGENYHFSERPMNLANWLQWPHITKKILSH